VSFDQVGIRNNCFSILKSQDWEMLNPRISGLKTWPDPEIRDPEIAIPSYD